MTNLLPQLYHAKPRSLNPEPRTLNPDSMLRHKANRERIQVLRDARGWSQEELARAAGYSVKTIWKAEAGRPLKRQTLADIARALGVDFSDIAESAAGPTLRRRKTRRRTD